MECKFVNEPTNNVPKHIEIKQGACSLSLLHNSHSPMKDTVNELGIGHANQTDSANVVLMLHGNAWGQLAPSQARHFHHIDQRIGIARLLLPTVKGRERRVLVHLQHLSLLRAGLGSARQYLELRTNTGMQVAFLLLLLL
mmetsp:Transcript_31803/g.93394  ORF Transcript_31803/g.93394 Transcript_31803/m.93394 type:complete len:140 (-) Transcript_31803:320-739(-)